MSAPKLTSGEIEAALADLPGWTSVNNKLNRTFQFPTFAIAFGFMAIAAIDIDKRDHHPEWKNVYNRIEVDLTTHDSGGITAKDVDLAKLLNEIAAKLS